MHIVYVDADACPVKEEIYRVTATNSLFRRPAMLRWSDFKSFREANMASLFAVFSTLLSMTTVHCDDPPNSEKKKLSYTISRETTYFTEPLRSDGTVDFAKALNERAKKNATAENNAVVLLAQALGPVMRPAPVGAKLKYRNFFSDLGMETPSWDKTYFIDLEGFLKERQKPIDSDKRFDLLYRLAGLPWSKEEFPDEAAWLERNEGQLSLAIEASKRTVYYWPVWTSGSELLTVVIDTYEATDLYRALLCRAMLRIHDKRQTEALEDILAAKRMVRMFAGVSDLHSHLSALALESMSLQAGMAWIADNSISSDQIRSYLASISKLSPLEPFANTLLFDRLVMIDSIAITSEMGLEYMEKLAGGRGLGGETKIADATLMKNLDWNPAMKKANAFFDRLEAILKNTNRKERQAGLMELDAEMKKLKEGARENFSERFAASKEERVSVCYDILQCLLLPSVLKVQSAVDKAEEQQRLHRLAIALALHWRDKQAYPARLEDLVPAYLSHVEVDLFTGKVPVYHPSEKGYRLYSLGQNGQDDHGEYDYDTTPRKDDILIEMPLKIKK